MRARSQPAPESSIAVILWSCIYRSRQIVHTYEMKLSQRKSFLYYYYTILMIEILDLVVEKSICKSGAIDLARRSHNPAAHNVTRSLGATLHNPAETLWTLSSNGSSCAPSTSRQLPPRPPPRPPTPPPASPPAWLSRRLPLQPRHSDAAVRPATASGAAAPSVKHASSPRALRAASRRTPRARWAS